MGASLRREIIISAAIIVGSLLLFLIGFWGLQSRMDDDIAAIRRAHAILLEDSQAVDTLAGLKRDAPQAAEYKKKLDLLLPTREELLGVNRAIDAAARVHSVAFRFSFQGGGADASPEGAGYVSFSIEAEGSYTGVKDFFEDLESKSSRFIMRFDAFSVEAKIDNQYKMSSQGKVFFH